MEKVTLLMWLEHVENFDMYKLLHRSDREEVIHDIIPSHTTDKNIRHILHHMNLPNTTFNELKTFILNKMSKRELFVYRKIRKTIIGQI